MQRKYLAEQLLKAFTVASAFAMALIGFGLILGSVLFGCGGDYYPPGWPRQEIRAPFGPVDVTCPIVVPSPEPTATPEPSPEATPSPEPTPIDEGQACWDAGKFYICHVPKNGNEHEICIDAAAANAHLSHHADYEGPCAGPQGN